MATSAATPSLATALHGDPPSGAVTDGAQAIADLLPSKEVDVPNLPDSSASDTGESTKKEELVEAPAPPGDAYRSKGKTALIMSALCVSFSASSPRRAM